MNKKICLAIIIAAAVAVPCSVLSCTTTDNRSPVITGLAAEAERVFPSGSTQIVCTALNSDGSELSYEWWASGGEIEGEGATVTWTAPDAEGLYNVRVTVTGGRGGPVTDHVTIRVKANEPPIITSLTADAEWTLPSGSLQVHCEAEDADGDELRYEWTASRGHIDGTEHEVTWTAPQQVGTYEITVVVDDGHGGWATRTLHVSVVTGQPPVIEALLITAQHGYLWETILGYEVGEGRDFVIRCTASHPDGLALKYEWECEGGEIIGISEDGSRITWRAPYARVGLTITVTVSDVYGNMVSRSLVLRVVSCG